MKLKSGAPTQIQPGDYLSIQFKPDLVIISIARSPAEALYFDNGDNKMIVDTAGLANLIGNIAGLRAVPMSITDKEIIHQFQKV